MSMRSRSPFSTVRTEGGIISAELLNRLAQQPDSLPGTAPADYHQPPGWRLRDAINRSWTDLQGAWAAFSTELARLGTGERATTLTRERWLLPLFAQLGYGRLARSGAMSIDGREYPVSHIWGAVPIHLLGADVDLDRKSRGVAGAAAASPHSMVQDLLNRSDAHLWGIVSNGRTLRALRDNTSLTRAAYVEFDLEDMFNGQVFADFAILWMLCHQSRFEADRPDLCWAETWVGESKRQGVRALDNLRSGFEQAITALGGGFLAHRGNEALREALRTGALTKEDYHRQVLRLVYRLVFLLVAEDRDLVHPEGTTEQQRALYERYYSLGRLRDQARRHRGTRHGDLWESVKPLFASLHRSGISAVGVPAFGSFLWSLEACSHFATANLANADLLSALRHLAYTQRDRALQRVDFVNLGPEELGSVYESLLELHPRIEADGGRFELGTAGGSERKTTGSYYTPTALISCLLDTALDPVLDRAEKAKDPEEALLSLTVLDPACGSGHFLIAAAQRIATRLAALRTGETSPPPPEVRHALRQVIGRCIYGIDVNPMAVELCKVNLWLEAVEPGRPLNFLENRIVCGNALIGATPEMLAGGVPDEAFKELTGDDKRTVTSLRKLNSRERAGYGTLFSYDLTQVVRPLAKYAAEVDDLGEEALDEVEAKAKAWCDFTDSAHYQDALLAAHTWCAAFVAPRQPGAPVVTESTYRTALSEPGRLGARERGVVGECAKTYGFLHPHLAFPALYGDGAGGFDVVLGNPPWDRVKLSEKEFFVSRAPQVAAAAGAKRRRLIAELQSAEPALWEAYQEALTQAEAESHFLHNSGRFPLCGVGDVNTYAVFAETMRSLVGPTGRAGVILPTGIATDDTTKAFFGAINGGRELASLYDFENREKLFPDIDSRIKFCLLTLSGRERPVEAGAELAFFCHDIAALDDPARRFRLSSQEIALLNPNTRTCPVFRSRRDAEITLGIYRRVPALIKDGDPGGNPWGISFRRLFDMTNDSGLFRTREELEAEGFRLGGNTFRKGAATYLPLYEGKMAHHFDHRWASHETDDFEDFSRSCKQDPAALPLPRYWVPEKEVDDRLGDWDHDWLLGFRGIAPATNERTIISAVIPISGVGNSFPLLVSSQSPRLTALLGASLASFALDFAARQKVGGSNVNFFLVEQFPVLPPATYDQLAGWEPDRTVGQWLLPRVLELTYTASDLAGFAADLGHQGPPFRWDEARRALLRAELDACFFHLYGLGRDEVDYVIGTFPIVERHDTDRFGEYRTKRLVLERYDAMAKAVVGGEPYDTALDPPPADPSLAH